jgi:hypothetical protein
MQLKKLEHWCEGVRTRAEKTLPSFLNAPTEATLLSSLPAPYVTVAESVSDNAGESDGEEDGAEEDDNYSENVLEIVLEQSGTADSGGAASGGTESPDKKVKITLTEEEENFAKKFRPSVSKIDKERKIPLRHVSGRGSFIKKQGARKHDVNPETMKQRLMTEYQRWEALPLVPENGHRRHLSYNSPQKSSFLEAQGQIEQVQD